MRLLPVGEDSLLVEVADAAEAGALYLAARRLGVEAADIVPAARTVLFRGVADPGAVAERLAGVRLAPGRQQERPLVEVPTVYDGPDLDAVARLWGMTRAEVVATHSGHELEVAFCGFAPGFAYCTGLPEELSVPRLDRPRPRVPVGAVGLAGPFTGVYPSASPGGWQLVGHTDLTLWDESREHPATLAPGTRVRFVPVPG